jgi:hypothetical protein
VAYVVEDNIIAETFAFGVRMMRVHERAKKVATLRLSSRNKFLLAFHETTMCKS